MALYTRQLLILLSCVSLILADYYDPAVYESRRVRTGRQSNPGRPERRLRPLKQRPAGPVPVPRQTGASSERFSSFGPGPGDYKNDFGNQPNFRPVIDEVDPALLAELEAMPQRPAQPREDAYVPASGPAYASPSMLSPVYANARQDLGPGQLEASVLAGAEAYGVAARPEGVYQNEERLAFQIHGQEGPHSYRYGYDTGNGFNRQFRYEERTNEGYVKGRYGFYDKYGKLQVVNYEADPIHGFHAEGAAVPKYPH